MQTRSFSYEFWSPFEQRKGQWKFSVGSACNTMPGDFFNEGRSPIMADESRLTIGCTLFLSIWPFFKEHVMHGSILPVTIPPRGTPPGICNFVHTWRSIPHPWARKKRNFPTPGTPHRPQLRYIDPYNSRTRRFDKNSNAFLEFLERKTVHV